MFKIEKIHWEMKKQAIPFFLIGSMNKNCYEDEMYLY